RTKLVGSRVHSRSRNAFEKSEVEDLRRAHAVPHHRALRSAAGDCRNHARPLGLSHTFSTDFTQPNAVADLKVGLHALPNDAAPTPCWLPRPLSAMQFVPVA